MPQPDQRRQIAGRLNVSQLGFGGAALGNLYKPVTDEAARQAIAAALDAGLRLFDTAPYYGYGLAERRLGDALSGVGRERLVLSTKVGRVLQEGLDQDGDGLFAVPATTGYRYDYSAGGIERSIEQSRDRLGVERLDIVLVHDLDPTVHTDPESLESHIAATLESGWPALRHMRDAATIGAIGFGINDWRTAERLVRATDPDVVLLAGRYTLLEQDAAHSFLPMCHARNIAVVIGGPFNGGILATGATADAVYDYRPATRKILDRVRRIEHHCQRHGVPLRAAALQFPFGHEAVVSVIPGMRSAAELEANMAAMKHPIPAALWQDLRADGLLDPSPGG